MASMPDMKGMMESTKQPSATERQQAQQALQSQADFMKYMVGDGTSGVLPQLYGRIDRMTSGQEIARQQGFRNVANQAQFNGGDLLRANALAGATGSGAGSSALRRAYNSFGEAQAAGATNTRMNAFAKQQEARVNYAKMGQGFADTVNTSLGNLGQIQSDAQQLALQKASAEQERALNSQMGYAGLGLGLAGMASGAMQGAITKDPKTGKSTFDWGSFGKGLGGGILGR